MAVSRIDTYRQRNGVDILKVILKPTKKFSDGYFYAPVDSFDLINKYTWFLCGIGNRVFVIANGDGYSRSLFFRYN